MKNRFVEIGLRHFLVLAIGCFLVCSVSKAQNFGTWTWMKGSQTPGTPAVNGTIGVPNSANNPPPMIEPAGFTDLQGRFWVYGGSQLASGAPPSAFQMWMFDPSTNNWTWMNGPSTPLAPANYGTQGIPSPTNHPGIRAGVSTWTDQDGNFWLFGNINPFALNNNNDLWKYDVATNEWIWMKGSNVTNNPGSYGTQGVPAMSNNPSARGRSSNWVDNNGDLWLYGGYCFCGNNYLLDDVWRYNIASNMWTWMGGSNSSMIPPNFGVMGVTSPTNTPGGRYSGSTWKDMNGDFWLYSGVSASAFFNQNAISDLWKYSPSSNLWTWMGGSNNVFLTDTFDVKCTPNTGYPAACDINPVSWIDDCGKLWQFGGEVRDFTAIGYTNLLWFYDPASSSFNWQGGSNTIMQPGIYGTQGVATSLNYPPSAMGGTGFKDNQGNFWMFGGCITPASPGAPCETNTLWKFVPDIVCSASASATPPQASINVNTPSLCDPLQINFQSGSNNPAYSYQWNFGDASSMQDTSSNANSSYSYTSPGIYTVALIVSANSACISGSDTATFLLDLSGSVPLASSFSAASCNAYTAPWGTVYTVSGAYSDTLQTLAGCDSIITVNLTIDADIEVQRDITSCGPYTSPGGTVYNQNTTFTSTFTSVSGCDSIVTFNITVLPPASVSVGVNDIAITRGDTVQLNATGADSYAWSPPDGLSCINCPAPLAAPQASGSWVVSTTNAFGCTASDSIRITVDFICNELFVPDIFSPNGIGNAENEKLCVYSNCIKSMNLGIYNRWGELIFSTDNQNDCWDGTHKGVPVMTGVYTYRLFVEQLDGEKIERSGNITLTR
jgi:gliding motility-associated-like protein